MRRRLESGDGRRTSSGSRTDGHYTAFSTLDVEAFLPYFHEPHLLIGPQGVFPIANHAQLRAAFTPFADDLRRSGFARSVLNTQEVKSLSASATLVTGIATRFRGDGSELERVGVTYVMHK